MPFTMEINPAIPIVVDGYERYIQQGNNWLIQTSSAVNSLANYGVQPIQFGTTFNLTNVEQAFVRPTKPAEPAVPGITTAVPDLPTLAALVLKSAGELPGDIDVSHLLGFTKPDRVDRAMPTRPDTNYPMIPLNMPSRPGYAVPVTPTLEQLGVVAWTPMQFQAFQGVRPSFAIPVPDDGQLAFQELEYTPALASSIQSALGRMMQGESGLPLVLEQAIFDRARAREDRLSRKQVQEVAEEFSQRGFSEPPGPMAARLREVRGDNREKVAALNQGLAIEVARIGVENVRSGVAQGIAWEQVLIAKVEAQNQRALQVAIFAREYALKRVDALVAIANLEQQAYATDAQVWKTLIEGELAKLAELEARIKLEALKGQVNENLIRQYEAQWKGVLAMADLYRTEVEAAKAVNEVNKQTIDKAEVEARIYGTEVDAWGKEKEGYRWDIEAALAPLKAAEIITGAHAQRINGYRAKAEAITAENRIQLDANGQTLDLARLGLQRADGVRQAEIAAVDAVLRRWAGAVAMYQADGSVAQAESASRDRVTALAIEQNRAQADIAVKGQELQVQQMLKIAELMQDKLKTLATVLSQLTAASQSAVNLGASVSYGSSDYQEIKWG